MWRPSGALAGKVFYGLAGVNHAFRARRSGHETMAMVADLLAALVLLACLLSLMGRRGW